MTTPTTIEYEFAPAPGVRRVLHVRVPDENALAVWMATGDRFASMGSEWATTEAALAGRSEDDPDLLEFRKLRREQSMNALARAAKVVVTALDRQSDRDWIEDEMLEQRLTIAQVMGILSGAVEQLRREKVGQQVAEAPKTGPKKAARRSA